MEPKKLHVKPTKAELAANALKAAEEAEKLPKEDPVETPPAPVEPPVEETPVEEEVVVTPEKPVEEEAPVEPPVEEPKKEEEVKPPVDYKQKFRESTREAKILHSKDKAMNEAIDAAANLPEPTDEEMTTQYTEWDVMSETERRIAKKTEMADRRMALLHKASTAGRDITAWNEKVDTFVGDPKTMIAHPDLEGKGEEFKLFAEKETRRGVDFEDLVKAFLYDVEKEEAAKPKKKGAMFPKGTGGANTVDNPSNKITSDELRSLRENNYNLYKEKLKLIKQKKIEVEAPI